MQERRWKEEDFELIWNSADYFGCTREPAECTPGWVARRESHLPPVGSHSRRRCTWWKLVLHRCQCSRTSLVRLRHRCRFLQHWFRWMFDKRSCKSHQSSKPNCARSRMRPGLVLHRTSCTRTVLSKQSTNAKKSRKRKLKVKKFGSRTMSGCFTKYFMLHVGFFEMIKIW